MTSAKLGRNSFKGRKFTDFLEPLEDSNFPRKTANTDADLAEMVSKIHEFFTEAGYLAGVMFGTLLGAVREKSLIDGDKDADFYVTDTFVENARDVVSGLEAMGFSVIRVAPEILSLRYRDAYCDFVVLKHRWFGSQLMTFRFPSKHFKEFSTVEINGDKWRAPSDPQRLLRMAYGSGWRIPQNGRPAIPNLPLPFLEHLFSLLSHFTRERVRRSRASVVRALKAIYKWVNESLRNGPKDSSTH